MDDEHARIINIELVPKEVQEQLSKFKLEDEPKHHKYIDEFIGKLVRTLTQKYAELNLPMCLSFIHKEADSGSMIPEDLKNRLITAKSRGNIDQFEAMFKNLKTQELNHTATISRLKDMLVQEKAQDDSIKSLPT